METGYYGELATPNQLDDGVCGFWGPHGKVLAEHDLRAAIQAAAVAEWSHWVADDGTKAEESADSQFGHLVRYWLAKEGGILPPVLLVVRARAMAQLPGIFGALLDSTPTEAQLAAAAAPARRVLLTGVPTVDVSPALRARVERALRSARLSRLDEPSDGPWSAVFVVSCVRGVGIKLGIERLADGRHIGRDLLLANTDEHREYTLASYRARFGPSPYDGAYHAFRPDEREPQVGDIIVQDRRPNIEPDQVVAFEEIPARFAASFPTHGDIVVGVSAEQNYVETVGGNVGDSVRRRRYPIGGNGRLIVSRTELYTQEENSGRLPDLPAIDNGPGLPGRSTRRIFALLSPVPAGLWEAGRQ